MENYYHIYTRIKDSKRDQVLARMDKFDFTIADDSFDRIMDTHSTTFSVPYILKDRSIELLNELGVFMGCTPAPRSG